MNTWLRCVFLAIMVSSNPVDSLATGKVVHHPREQRHARRAQFQPLAREYKAPVSVPPAHGWNIDLVDITEAGRCIAVHISGTIMYAAFEATLVAIDISIPSNPHRIGYAMLSGTCWDIAQKGNYLYCGLYPADLLEIVDVSNPSAPFVIGSRPADGGLVEIEGTYLYHDDADTIRVLDISNPTDPVEVGSVTTYIPSHIAVQSGYVYVAEFSRGLQIIDATNPANPVQVGFLPVASGVQQVDVSGRYAYAVSWIDWDGGYGLYVIDVVDPANPVITSYVPGFTWVHVVVEGPYAYVLDVDHEVVHVFDVGNPTNPVPVASSGYCDGWDPVALAVSGGIAAVNSSDGVLCLIDVSSPLSPIEVASYESLPVLLSLDIADGYIAASLEYGSLIMVNRYDTGLRSWMWGYSYDVDYNDVVARDGYAYIGNCDTWHMESGLEVVDISDPTQPTRVGFLYQSGCILEVALGLTHVYYHDWYKIAVVDVSDPYHPTAVGQLAMTDASGIYVQEPYLYVACGGYGLKVVDVSNPSAPVVVGSSYFPGFGALDVWVSAGYAYVCGYNASTGIGLWIFNVTNPMAPALVATFATNDYAERIWGRDTYLYIACDEFFRILDVADPTNPLEVGNIAFNRLQGRIGIAPPYIYAIQGVIGAASGALLKLQTSLITAVHEERRFADTLEQNYPNPFNPATTIRYSISKQGHVSLRIYNAAGQLVRTLVDQEQTPRGGGYVATWDSTDNNGIHVASGVYFCRMTANEFSETKKMVVIK